MEGPLIENFEEIDQGINLKPDLNLFSFFDSDDDIRESYTQNNSD